MNKKGKTAVLNGTMAIICSLLLLVFLFPYVYVVLSSFKPAHMVVTTNPTILPEKWSLENYQLAFSSMPVEKYFINSLIASVFSTVCAMMFGCAAAYCISRLKQKKLATGFLLLTMAMRLIPMVSIAIPMFSISISWKLYDTLWILIGFYIAFELPFITWMMVGYFDTIPRELDEAAMMDGCGPLRAFISAIIPVSKPGLASTAILAFIMPWNDFMFALFVTSRAAKTLPVGLAELVTAYDINLAPMTAVSTVFSFPLILITFYLQRYIVSGMTIGSVKG